MLPLYAPSTRLRTAFNFKMFLTYFSLRREWHTKWAWKFVTLQQQQKKRSRKKLSTLFNSLLSPYNCVCGQFSILFDFSFSGLLRKISLITLINVRLESFFFLFVSIRFVFSSSSYFIKFYGNKSLYKRTNKHCKSMNKVFYEIAKIIYDLFIFCFLFNLALFVKAKQIYAYFRVFRNLLYLWVISLWIFKFYEKWKNKRMKCRWRKLYQKLKPVFRFLY